MKQLRKTLACEKMVDQIILIALGGILASIGFVTRRWYVGEAANERATRLGTLVQVAAQLKSGEVTLEELHELEASIGSMGRGKSLQGRLSAERPVETQAELNEAAAIELRKLNAELAAIIELIEPYLEPQERGTFAESQKTWERFRDLHAQVVADLFAGGSMRPLLYITCVDRATRDRIEELSMYLDQKRGG